MLAGLFGSFVGAQSGVDSSALWQMRSRRRSTGSFAFGLAHARRFTLAG